MNDPIGLWTAISAVPGIGPFLPYIAAAIAVCAAVATVLPPPKQRGVYAIVYTALNWVALNLGRAKNAAKPPVPSPADTVSVPAPKAGA